MSERREDEGRHEPHPAKHPEETQKDGHGVSAILHAYRMEVELFTFTPFLRRLTISPLILTDNDRKQNDKTERGNN